MADAKTTENNITLEQFLEIGFEHAAMFDPTQLEFRQDVRDMCNANQCHQYGKNWACPPACGSVADSVEKAKGYKNAVMLQTTAFMEDSFDIETMMQAAQDHKDRFAKAVDLMRATHPDCLPMGAGGCNICRKCTYPDAPCRFPDRAFTSMEAYGLYVAGECKKAGLEYNYGSGSLTYSSCILY